MTEQYVNMKACTYKYESDSVDGWPTSLMEHLQVITHGEPAKDRSYARWRAYWRASYKKLER